ncbi:MAG: DUF4234 domain-containing protein [Acholeplasmatales bacterium]|nr:DUF4234 domain-containing protein [Acholeplasmatales bacterium]
MKNRSVLAVVLLSIITCGIYEIYWYYVMTEDINRADSTKPSVTNAIVAVLLGIITCGIYLIYWQYRFYEKSDAVTKKSNVIVYFILAFFGFSIISNALLQSDINQISQ